MPLRNIWVYDRAGQAEYAQDALARVGIEAMLRDENANRTQSSRAVSVAVLVEEDDAERALATLRKAQPEVFGSVTNVARIESTLVRWIGIYLAYVAASGAVCFIVVAPRGELLRRCEAALLLGVICAIPLVMLHARLTSKNG